MDGDHGGTEHLDDAVQMINISFLKVLHILHTMIIMGRINMSSCDPSKTQVFLFTQRPTAAIQARRPVAKPGTILVPCGSGLNLEMSCHTRREHARQHLNSNDIRVKTTSVEYIAYLFRYLSLPQQQRNHRAIRQSAVELHACQKNLSASL